MVRVILLHVLSFLSWPSDAVRIDIAELSARIDHIANDTAELSARIDHDHIADELCNCGAAEATGTLLSKSNETVKFTVGEGVDFKPAGSCVVDCIATDGTCSSLKRTKVAKNSNGGKLCCEVKKCTWVPTEEKWIEKPAQKMQLFPLVSLDGVSMVPGNSCLCCTKTTTWGPQVNNQCKYAYGASDKGFKSNKGLWAKSIADTFTFGVSMTKWIEKCRAYCPNFPDYPEMLKTIKMKSWRKEVTTQLTELHAKLVDAVNEAGEIIEASQPDKCTCDMGWNQFEHFYAMMVNAEEGHKTNVKERAKMFHRVYHQQCGCEAADGEPTPDEKEILQNFLLWKNIEKAARVYHSLEEVLDQVEKTNTWGRKLRPEFVRDAKAAFKKMKVFEDKIKAFEAMYKTKGDVDAHKS